MRLDFGKYGMVQAEQLTWVRTSSEDCQPKVTTDDRTRVVAGLNDRAEEKRNVNKARAVFMVETILILEVLTFCDFVRFVRQA